MNRAAFLVDGFNLYHGIREASTAFPGKTAKWLDLKRLCRTYLHVVRERRAGIETRLERVYYFSAPPSHRSTGSQGRHALYMECLRGTGVNVELSRFKQKEVFCVHCRQMTVTHQEKETDVALAAKLFEVCCTNEADTIVLVTGDTDLRPAVATCRRLFPEKLVFFAFPFKRVNAELQALAPESFKIRAKTILSHQFADPLVLVGGRTFPKPAEW